MLNKEFQRIIGEKKVSADYEVKDVVMVNIEQLMRLENFFAAEKLDLAYLINSYIEYKPELGISIIPFFCLVYYNTFRLNLLIGPNDNNKTDYFRIM